MAEPRTPLLPESLLKIIDLSSENDLRLERNAVRTLDYTILPMMTLFQLVSSLDRSNIGNARVAGLQKDLHMTDTQYQICVTVLYIPYIVSEIPSNLLLRKLNPSFFLPTLVTIWGIVVILQGFVTSYPGLITVRAVLGLLESLMIQGIVLYGGLSGFYTRRELSVRIGIFYSSIPLSGDFSGLLAAAIEKMKGVGGRPGWTWIFIPKDCFQFSLALLVSSLSLQLHVIPSF